MLTDDELQYQEEIRKLQDVDLRCMRFPTRMSRIAECVPMPCNPIPDDALPRWETLPLTQKFPVIPCPEGQFRLSRNRVGHSLFECQPCSNFDTGDPYIRQTPIAYDSLHDPNLDRYFKRNPQLLRNLEQQGLVNETGKVDCTISDFNKYRDYLSRIHNKCINNELERQDEITDVNNGLIKKITNHFTKEENDRKQDEAKARREECRSEIDKRNLMNQIKKLTHPCISYKERLAVSRTFLTQRREYLRQQKMARIEEMKWETRERNRQLVLEWFCKDLYVDKLKEYNKKYKKTQRNNDLEGFVKCKREYQEKKVRYERAILLLRIMERHSAIIKRREHFEKLEITRRQNVTKRAVRKQKKAERELYLMRKYGRKWLAFVAAKKKEVSAFHDSLWHLRQQLREMVGILREESGAVSFSSFIQGLVALKPGRVSISTETLEVVNDILSYLLDKAFKEYIRKTTSSALDFLSEETRTKMARFYCPGGPTIPLEDFIPPDTRRCFRPQIPYEKPYWPCTGPCADLVLSDISNHEWKRKCGEMAKCLTDVHNAVSKPLVPKTRCQIMMEEILREQKRQRRRRKKSKKEKARLRRQKSGKSIDECSDEPKAKPKYICPFNCDSERTHMSVADLEAQANESYQTKFSSMIQQRQTEAGLGAPNQRRYRNRPEIRNRGEGSVGHSESSTKAPHSDTNTEELQLGECTKDNWKEKCSKMAQCLSDVHLSMLGQPLPPDESFVEQTIKDKLAEFQTDRKPARKSGSAAIEGLVDTENTSMSSSRKDKSSPSQPKSLGTVSTGPGSRLEPPQSKPKSTVPTARPPYPSEPPQSRSKATAPSLEPPQSKSKATAPSLEPPQSKSKATAPPLVPPQSKSKATAPPLVPPQSKSKATAPPLEPPQSKSKATARSLVLPQSKSKVTVPPLEPPQSKSKAVGTVDNVERADIDKGIRSVSFSQSGKPKEPTSEDTAEEAGISDFVDDDRVSSTSSIIVKNAISTQAKLIDPCPDKSSLGHFQPDTAKEAGISEFVEVDRVSSTSSIIVKNVISDQAKLIDPCPDKSALSHVQPEVDQLNILTSDQELAEQAAVAALVDDDTISRISSAIVKGAICDQIKLIDPCAEKLSKFSNAPTPSPSDESFVDDIILKQQRKLQHEKDVIGGGDETAIDALANDENLSRISSGIVKRVICEQKRLIDCSTTKPSCSDTAFVDEILLEQQKKLQHEKDVIEGGDETAIDAAANDENLSRISSGIVKRVICEQARLIDPCNLQESSLDASSLSDGTISNKLHKQSEGKNSASEDHDHEITSNADAGFQQGDVPYLDPEEQGISPVRSEIRQHLNSIRGELDNLKNQLTRQGIIKPPTPPDT